MIVTYLFIAVVMIGFLVHVVKTVMKIEVWVKGVLLDGAKVKTEYHVNGK